LRQFDAGAEAPNMRSPSLPRLEPSPLAQVATGARASEEDLRVYLPYLNDTNLSEAQKIELLQALWSIMSACVDLAFGADPVQQSLPSSAAGQDTDDPIASPAKSTGQR
jgi:hypothetical protein